MILLVKSGLNADNDVKMEVRNQDPRMKINRSIPVPCTLSQTIENSISLPPFSKVVSYLLSLEIRPIEKGESWMRAQRRVARIVYFITMITQRSKLNITSKFTVTLPRNFKNMTRHEKSVWIRENELYFPSQQHLECARVYWVVKAQCEFNNKKQIRSILSLNPIKDDNGVWRAHGRTMVVVNPPIIIPKCALAKVLLSHYHMCENYDTRSFLDALSTFTDVRGSPQKLIADQGSQIVGAKNVLESVWDHIDQIQLQNSTASSTVWEFVPAGAHSFLGQAERLIQSFKTTMDAVYFSKNPRMTKTRFSRMLYAIASIMNSRPLAIHCNRASKLEDSLIRPNDLLLGRSTAEIAPLVHVSDNSTNVSGDPKSYLELLLQKEAFLNEFWVKWRKVVFPSLMPRTKWHTSGRSVVVGDIVLIRDTNPIKGCWSWGEVVQADPSSDGEIRKSTVRYKSSNPSLLKSRSKFVVKSVRDLCLVLKAEDRNDIDSVCK